ncbi:hypothetical protein VNI00_015316 [Paramarasmius palmivorus]|uniref:Uncharacterized protein n=1 Tax=Paramarasmius palmivorus TaxID=297713 RepID=A0AAW0BMA2_9AGAR
MSSPFSATPSESSSTSHSDLNGLGTSCIALSVLPLLAVVVYVSRRCSRWHRKSRTGQKSMGISSTDFFAAEISGEGYRKRIILREGLGVYRETSSRLSIVLVNRTTKRSSDTARPRRRATSPQFLTTYQPIGDSTYYSSFSSNTRSPQNRFPSYRPPPAYPFSDTSLATSQALLWGRNADLVVGSHPSALPMRSRMRVSTPIVDIDGKLLIHIPWKPDWNRYGHKPNPSYAADLSRDKHSRRRSHTVHCEQNLARIYDGNVDDRYPLALSTSCVSLYSQAPTERSLYSQSSKWDTVSNVSLSPEIDQEDMSQMLDEFPAVPISFDGSVAADVNGIKANRQTRTREFTGVDLNDSTDVQAPYILGHGIASNGKGSRGKGRGKTRRQGWESKENIVPF